MPRGGRELPERCVKLLRGAELIVHAGDFTKLSVLEELERLGPPVIAVHGNVDEPELRRRLPERVQFSFAQWRIGVVHDAGPRRGRLRRLKAQFSDSDAAIFGHSHIPLHERAEDHFQIFNPGSPTERRRAPSHTMGLLRAEDDLLRFELVEL